MPRRAAHASGRHAADVTATTRIAAQRDAAAMTHASRVRRLVAASLIVAALASGCATDDAPAESTAPPEDCPPGGGIGHDCPPDFLDENPIMPAEERAPAPGAPVQR